MTEGPELPGLLFVAMPYMAGQYLVCKGSWLLLMPLVMDALQAGWTTVHAVEPNPHLAIIGNRASLFERAASGKSLKPHRATVSATNRARAKRLNAPAYIAVKAAISRFR